MWNTIVWKQKTQCLYVFFVYFGNYEKNGEYEMFNPIKSKRKTITIETNIKCQMSLINSWKRVNISRKLSIALAENDV